MRIEELRLGNWVYNTDVPIQVSYIDGEEPDFNPIPLTPEILEKAGFEKTGWDYWSAKAMCFELRDHEDGTFCYCVNCGEYDCGENIEYLHQLQNLYFALTGQELDIQL